MSQNGYAGRPAACLGCLDSYVEDLHDGGDRFDMRVGHFACTPPTDEALKEYLSGNIIPVLENGNWVWDETL